MKKFKVLLDEETIAKRVRELGEQITRDYAGAEHQRERGAHRELAQRGDEQPPVGLDRPCARAEPHPERERRGDQEPRPHRGERPRGEPERRDDAQRRERHAQQRREQGVHATQAGIDAHT